MTGVSDLTLTDVTVHRPGLRSWLVLCRCEAKMIVRDTAGLVVPIGLPLLILVMNAQTAADEVVTAGRTALDLFVLPLVFAIVIATIGVINMPSFLAYYRRTGILRRLAVTPASPAMVLTAQMVVSLVQAVIGVGVAFAVAVVAFGANPPVDVGVAVGVVALAVTAMYALGLVVAAVAPTPNSAVAIGLVVFFGIAAVGGLFGDTSALPDPVATVGHWLPFGASVDALSSAWAGEPVEGQHLAALAGATVVGGGLAAALFRWE